MNVQDAANLTIPEGNVRNIHDKNNQLLWSAVGYDVKYKGNTTQQTYTGKNLIDFGDGTYTAGGTTATRDGNTVTVTGKRTSSTNYMYFTNQNISFGKVIPAGTYTLSITSPVTKQLQISLRDSGGNHVGSLNVPIGETSVTATINEDIYSFRAAIYPLSNGEEVDIVFQNIQLESGSTPTSYEPYVGGIPAPNPDYPQAVNVVKGAQSVLTSAKNLLSVSFATVGGVPYDIPTNTFILDRVGQRFFRCDFPTLLPAGTYTISFDVSDNNTAAGINFTLFNRLESTILNITQISRGSTSSHYSGTFTINEDIKIIRWFIASNESNDKHATISNVQVEAGSTATAYEMYQGQQNLPIDLIGKNLFDKNGKITADSWLRNDGSLTAYATGWSVTDYIPISPNTSYTTSGMESGSGVNPSRCYYDKDKNFISGIKHNNANPFTNTAPANAYYLRDSFKTDDINTLQLEVGSATTYAPYYNYELCKIGNYQDYIFKSSGKNLVDAINSTWQTNNTTLTKTDGIFRMTAVSGKVARAVLPLTGLVEGETYTISFDALGASISSDNLTHLRVREGSSSGDWVGSGVKIGTSSSYVRYSTSFVATSVSNPYAWFYLSPSADNTNNVEIYVKNIQLEKSSTDTPYEPYGTDWYVRKETGAVTLTGSASENWDLYIAGEVFRIRVLDMMGQDNQGITAPLYCKYYTPRAYSVITSPGRPDYGIAGRATSANGIAIRNKDCADVTAFKSWLGTHNTTAYYALATPTYTKITDTTLIGQLSAIHDWLRRYDYYGVVSGNLPIIIDRTGII